MSPNHSTIHTHPETPRTRGHDPALPSELVSRRVLPFAERAGRSGEPVLLTGETGSGKTHLAMLIHRLSQRSRGPFVRVNCGAIPDSLFEREMFGHVKGAFTDARESRAGLFEAANGGTLFLDEVGELALHLQAKLLAVLEEKSVRRLGAVTEVRVDVRVLSATNADLPEMMRCKHFRGDLFHRLAVLRFRTPSLRERSDELPGLLQHLLARLATQGPPFRISMEAVEALCAYPWPGNLRELDNALRHAAAYADEGEIRPEHLPEDIVPAAAQRLAPHETQAAGRRYSAPDDPQEERQMIVGALRQAKGNRTRAARCLGMSRSALWIKLQRYGLQEHVPAV